MSWETQSWAAKQRPGSASAKLVLLGLASCADANHCAFPSVQWLCDFSDLNRKTVISAIQRLEDGMFPLIEDTGERRGRTGQVKVYRLAVNEGGREPGAMTHYVYKLIHPETGQYYIGVRSFIGDPVLDGYMGSGNWPIAARAAGITLDKHILAVKDSRDEADVAEAIAIKQSIGDRLCMNIEYKDTEKGVPKTGPLNDPEMGTLEQGNSPAFSVKQSQKRDTEPFLEPNPPLAANAAKAPAADLKDGSGKDQAGTRRERGSRLPEDWTAPPVADLSPMALKLVQQWPAGAYEAVCETFRLHWHCETRAIGCKRDWDAALAKWLISDHAKIMRDAKAGVSFAGLVPAKASTAAGAATPRPQRPVAAKAREDERSQAIHAALRRELGAALYDTWIAGAALIHDAPGVIVIAGSEFVRAWIEDRFQSKIMAAARAVLGSGVRWVRFQIEVEHNNSGREGAGR